MTKRAAPSEPGRVLLQAFMTENGINRISVSRQLRVSKSLVTGWLDKGITPGAENRDRMAIWSEGAIPVESWVDADDRKGRAKIVPARLAMKAEAAARRAS